MTDPELSEKVLEVFEWSRTASGPGCNPSWTWRDMRESNNALNYHDGYPTADKALAAGRLAICPTCPTPTEWMQNRSREYDCDNCQRAREVLGDGS